MAPHTRYARSGNVHIAYQVIGGGPIDLVFVPGFVSNVEECWEQPGLAAFLERLASFARLILFDKRGTGLSDRVPEHRLPTLEERMDDLRAVLDAAGSKEAVLFGHSEGGSMCILFAATYPERTRALITFGVFARRRRSDDYPWAPSEADRQATIALVESEWASDVLLRPLVPSRADDRAFLAQLATYFRRSASPGAAAQLLRMNTEIDVRAILPAIRVPTLVLHRTEDRDARVEEGRWISSRIHGAIFVELPGGDHIFWVGDTETVLAEIEAFLTGARPVSVLNRVLATVLFTDIVASTEAAARLGDRRWREALETHRAGVRSALARWRGEEIATTGDGFLVVFDGPARGIRCALAIRDDAGRAGFQVRAGLHTGEIERDGDQIAGVAVHIGSRVVATAEADEVVVSSTVKDLVAGSGITFADRGMFALRGVPDEWRLYTVTGA
ncbi:MAG: adenylate/guanylate cyclase domain-containing protein [Candidatus Limnocylindria bacterium]